MMLVSIYKKKRKEKKNRHSQLKKKRESKTSKINRCRDGVEKAIDRKCVLFQAIHKSHRLRSVNAAVIHAKSVVSHRCHAEFSKAHNPQHSVISRHVPNVHF